MSDVGNSFPGLRLKSVDGTSFWITGDSPGDYVLHPVFLRFFFLVMLVYAFASQRPDLAQMGGWGLVLLWTAASCVMLAWLALWSPMAVRLMRAGRLRQFYTPVLLLPMVIVTEATVQAVTVLLGAGGWKPLTATLQQVARDIVVVTLVDLLHSHFVVHAHPLARRQPGSEQAAQAEVEAPVVQTRDGKDNPVLAGETAPEEIRDDGFMVQIGPVALPMTSLLLIRTEDHYLGVTTRSGKALHRAKMADIAELHTGIAGMQINRSVWIAFAAIRDVVEAENRQVVVSLVTGDEERVSKPRAYAFRQAHAKWRAAHSAG